MVQLITKCLRCLHAYQIERSAWFGSNWMQLKEEYTFYVTSLMDKP